MTAKELQEIQEASDTLLKRTMWLSHRIVVLETELSKAMECKCVVTMQLDATTKLIWMRKNEDKIWRFCVSEEDPEGKREPHLSLLVAASRDLRIRALQYMPAFHAALLEQVRKLTQTIESLCPPPEETIL